MAGIPHILKSRPGMYLATYDQKFDAASLIVNFLIALCDSFEFLVPDSVDILAIGEVFRVVATGCRLGYQGQSVKSIAEIFSGSEYQQAVNLEIPLGLSFLTPIVWFTEYCLLDLSTIDATYRLCFAQGNFQNGNALTSSVEGLAPRIGFTFTLPSEVFESRVLALTRLKQVLSVWEMKDYAKAIADKEQIPRIAVDWYEQTQYHYWGRLVLRSQKDLS